MTDDLVARLKIPIGHETNDLNVERREAAARIEALEAVNVALKSRLDGPAFRKLKVESLRVVSEADAEVVALNARIKPDPELDAANKRIEAL